MNYNGAGNIDTIMSTAMAADVLALIERSSMPVAVVLTYAGATTYTPATLSASVSETSDTVQGYRAPQDLGKRETPGWQEGDSLVAVVAASCVNGTPEADTRVTVDGAAWRVLSVSTDALSLHHKLHLRRHA